MTYMHGKVTDFTTGKPIPKVEIDIWHTAPNGLYEQQDPDQPDMNLRGRFYTDADGKSGPLWAEAGSELYGEWLSFHATGGFVPFGQIHGHSQIVGFRDRSWRVAGRIRQRTTVDWEARHVRVRAGGRVLIGVDPKHGRSGAASWRPLELDGATVLFAGHRPADAVSSGARCSAGPFFTRGSTPRPWSRRSKRTAPAEPSRRGRRR